MQDEKEVTMLRQRNFPSLNTTTAAITQKPPFCTGTVSIAQSDADLFYKQGKSASWLNLSTATEDDLQALANACQPATFGMNEEDVLDESYRKAGKMDLHDFAAKFDVNKLGILNRIRAQLLDGADEKKVVNAALYKLNVYGRGSFFKSHKDTPRGETMFGSLVVVFPTHHEGGALVLRHFGQEWTFDSATLTQQRAEPCIAYIAFYSDVDHEVTIVSSGYRVTLTYNLYLVERAERDHVPRSIQPVAPDDHILHCALTAALANPDFLPEGGYLGFGLSFKYPIQQAQASSEQVLKGSDAVIYRVCKQLSLKASLNAVYSAGRVRVLVSTKKLLSNSRHDDDIVDVLCNRRRQGKVIHEFGEDEPVRRYGRKFADSMKIRLAWVTPLTVYSHFGSPYTAYGNERTSACIYGDLCITVQLGPFGQRETEE
ncbi:putative 2OG-Fe(II) oxygenase superfamily protein [Lyophyllum shimeji]|uniref:2OG-Fe(II) oxygenase superfamily protein n=1 Tax=Lyophyllum shimeji TaxID=47721 RepID=A0A9P3Q1Y0_LYOSH|nr:putative 2OG-Fe(II) oxygenase superfamily protein [Lyophyllum shimeji]